MPNNNIRLIIEKNIPFVKGLLDPYATVQYLAPEDITPRTVREIDGMVIRTRTRCDETLLAKSECKMIATATIGTDHIDKDYCKNRSITVVNAPGCNAPAVAQYVFATLLNVINRPLNTYTIGIVGGLIVGQAAVEAGLVSTIVVIVVALAALASFTIPNESFASAYRLLKFFLIIVSAVWGLYGFILGMLLLAIHLSGMTSYGIPYMTPAVSTGTGEYESRKDFILRLPIYLMRKRPVFTKEGERIRMRRR